MRRRTVIGIVVGMAAVLGVTGAAAAAGDDQGYPVRTEQVQVPGTPEPGEGAVTLDATLYLPQRAGRAPAVLLAHGFGDSKDDLDQQARDLAARGYVTLAYSARGFGRSGGRIHLDAPDFEVADGSRLIDLLATRAEVLLDAAGDPRVGVAGASYGGGLALLLAGHDRRVDAIIPQITWNDLRQALFPQFRVGPAASRSAADLQPDGVGVFKKGWAGTFFSPSAEVVDGRSAGPVAGGAGGADPADGDVVGTVPGLAAGPVGAPRPSSPAQAQLVVCGRFAAVLCTEYQRAATTGQPTATLLDLLTASSPASVLDKITAPTLLVQGEADSLFPLSEADANARGIAARGTPVKVIWFSGGHDGGGGDDAESRRITDTGYAWFDRYLQRDGSAPDTRFEVTVPSASVSSTDGRVTSQLRVAAGESGVTSAQPLPVTPITLTGPEQVVQAPAGGSPAALTSVPGLGQALGAVTAGGAGSLLSALPGQTARFESAPLERTLRLAGGSRATLRVSGDGTDATLFGQLYDVGPGGGGSAVLPERLVAPIRLPSLGPAAQDVTIELPAVVRDVAAGHRLRLVISTTDQGYALPGQPRQYRIASAGDGRLAVPEPELTAVDAGGVLALWPWAAALLAATVAVLVAGRLLLRRRDRAVSPDPGLAHVPLAIEGLGKAYGDGYRAVTDLSFRVEPGWVLGLLGPNGAGKTTTLRMLMGLIKPTEGRIRVFGHTVTAGAPVLSRIGSFVEGPGFLPHVSGLANLRLYWQATGRPEADAHLADALEIAGLADDIERRVKTYSQGMRQRLAIAQAMLGLPDLLVLDEPTNGLDPPQIREMREVLSRYAATGRTVVVSSHLLSEVEQTCSHVVVMHRGRLVAQGPVAELVGSATALLVDVDDPVAAAAVARGVAGVQDVDTTPTGLVLTVLGGARGDLVRALVEAGLSVERVSPQRGLEEAFLALVGES